MPRRKLYIFRYVFVTIWGLCTISLSAWWLYFGLRQVHRLGTLDQSTSGEILRYHKMLVGEGAFLFFLLVTGIGALTYFMIKEMLVRRRIEEFFAAFTHELKTPLASLMLNAELISEQDPHSESYRRLVSDLARLNLQLENSLFLVSERSQLLTEKLRLREMIARFDESYPTLKLNLEGDCVLELDRRAADAIFGNLVSNAVQHGKASQMSIEVKACGNGMVTLLVRDNGSGFHGNAEKLGSRFYRHYPGSGTGLGLSLVRELVRRHGGKITFPPAASGFTVELTLPGTCI